MHVCCVSINGIKCHTIRILILSWFYRPLIVGVNIYFVFFSLPCPYRSCQTLFKITLDSIMSSLIHYRPVVSNPDQFYPLQTSLIHSRPVLSNPDQLYPIQTSLACVASMAFKHSSLNQLQRDIWSNTIPYSVRVCVRACVRVCPQTLMVHSDCAICVIDDFKCCQYQGRISY